MGRLHPLSHRRSGNVLYGHKPRRGLYRWINKITNKVIVNDYLINNNNNKQYIIIIYNTLKDSLNYYDINGKKIRALKCKAKIYYIKNNNEYYLKTEYSHFCLDHKPKLMKV